MPRKAAEILDEYLVLCAQDGQSIALEALVDRWQARLLRHARRLLGDDAPARDAVQESWISMVKGLRRLDDPARFRAWAFRIVTRRCADVQRGEARRRQIERQAERPKQPAPAPELDELQRALARMAPARRALLSLHYLEQMPLREIAEVLELPEGTVKSRLFHARKELKEQLQRSLS